MGQLNNGDGASFCQQPPTLGKNLRHWPRNSSPRFSARLKPLCLAGLEEAALDDAMTDASAGVSLPVRTPRWKPWTSAWSGWSFRHELLGLLFLWLSKIHLSSDCVSKLKDETFEQGTDHFWPVWHLWLKAFLWEWNCTGHKGTNTCDGERSTWKDGRRESSLQLLMERSQHERELGQAGQDHPWGTWPQICHNVDVHLRRKRKENNKHSKKQITWDWKNT